MWHSQRRILKEKIKEEERRKKEKKKRRKRAKESQVHFEQTSFSSPIHFEKKKERKKKRNHLKGIKVNKSLLSIVKEKKRKKEKEKEKGRSQKSSQEGNPPMTIGPICQRHSVFWLKPMAATEQ